MLHRPISQNEVCYLPNLWHPACVFGITDLPTYLAGLAVIIVMPGPNSLYVLSVAARLGVQQGYRAAFGVFCGDTTLMVLSAAGSLRCCAPARWRSQSSRSLAPATSSGWPSACCVARGARCGDGLRSPLINRPNGRLRMGLSRNPALSGPTAAR